MATIRTNLNKLKESDIWSFVLFTLFKIREIPEYSSLSELAFILDKSELLKLCEYFGGQTITIPTIDDLEITLYGLLLYELVEVEKVPYDEAMESISSPTLNLKKVRGSYIKIKNILTSYELSSRSTNNG